MIRHKQPSGMVQRRTSVGLILFLLLVSGIYFWWTYNSTDSAYGKFIGKVTSTWNDDERDMTLERDFEYVDPRGKRWIAAAGSVINGASIPQAFWSVIGGPFEGKFRNAAVIHDAACGAQVEPWEDAHRMFYDACRCGRVGIGKAQTMYWAVYHFGPRWQRVTENRTEDGKEVVFTRLVLEQPPQPDPAIVAKAERYFNKLRFTPKEIEECTVADIENQVAKWDAKRAAGN